MTFDCAFPGYGFLPDPPRHIPNFEDLIFPSTVHCIVFPSSSCCSRFSPTDLSTYMGFYKKPFTCCGSKPNGQLAHKNQILFKLQFYDIQLGSRDPRFDALIYGHALTLGEWVFVFVWLCLGRFYWLILYRKSI